MADFFSRIAERTLGLAPVVRPNVPPKFAPIPPIETSVEVSNPHTTETKDDVPPRQDLTGDYAEPAVTEHPALAPTQAQPSRRSSHKPQIPPSRADARVEPDTSRPETSGPELRDFKRMFRAPDTPTTDNSEGRAPRYSDSAPTVQVTIGRVEVRAVAPVPQAPRPIERKRVPLLSLEEYLRGRNGKHR
jgi:hypothetical protein